MTFRDTLRGALENQDMTGRELANRVGVAPSTVSRWLHGSEYPRERILAKLAKATRIPLDDLIDTLAAERPVREARVAPASSNRDRLAQIELDLGSLAAMVEAQGETLAMLRDVIVTQTQRTARPTTRRR